MTVATTTRKAILPGNGINTNFGFNFAVRSAADLQVYYTDANGVQTLLAANLYTVALNPIPNGQLWTTGGSVTYPLAGAAIAAGTVLTIARAVPLTQTSTLINQGGYNPQTVEQALDVLAMAMQQINETIARSLYIPLSSTASTALPAPLANALIGWDPTGTMIINVAAAGSIPLPVGIGSGGTGSNTAGGALTNLGFSAYVKTLLAAATAAALRLLFTPLTTKGDLWVFDVADTRKAIGGTGAVLMSDPAQADSMAWNPAAFNWKNRLINPDARIYVRAAAATANSTYFANNWYLLSQTGTCLPSALADPEDGYPAGVRITQSQAAAQRFGFAQVIEGRYCKDLRGKSGVLVPRIRASAAQNIRYAILGWTGTEDTVTRDVVNDWTSAVYTTGNFFKAANMVVLATGVQQPGANVWTSLAAITSALGSAFNNIIVMVWTEGTAAQNFTLDFDYVQFERGSVATDFERRPYTIEDLMCQRYLPSVVLGTGTQDVIAYGGCTSTVLADCFFPFKVEARAIPTGLTVSAVGHFSVYDSAIGVFVATGMAIGPIPGSRYAASLRANTAGVMGVNDPAFLHGNAAGAGRFLYFTGAEL